MSFLSLAKFSNWCNFYMKFLKWCMKWWPYCTI